MGTSGAERQIINVAPGEISAASTDAINGSQLFHAINAATTEVKAGNHINISSTTGADGHLIYTVNANHTVVDFGESTTEATGTRIANQPFTISNSTSADGTVTQTLRLVTTPLEVKDGVVQKYTNASSNRLVNASSVADAINQSGWFVNTGITGSGEHNSSNQRTIVSPGNDVTFLAGNNLIVDQDANRNITYSVNPILTEITSIAMAAGNAGINMNNGNINNLAAAQTGDQAVNLSQLNASKANVVAGTNVQVSSSSDENGTTYTVNAYNTTASGSELVSVVAGELDPTTNTTNYAIDLSDKAKAQLAKEESVEAGSDAVSVKLDGTNETGGNKYVVDLSDETKTQLAKEEGVSQGNNVIVTANGTNETGGKDFLVSISNNLDLTETGSLTIGDVNIAGDKVDVGGNTITNVTNGTNATDAVNLSQLNASKANVVAGTNVQVSSTSDENGTTYTVNAYNTTASGSELVSVVAGELDPTTNTTNYAIDLSEAAKAQLAKEESVEAGSDAVSVKLDGTNETGGNKYVVDLSDETKTQLAKEESVSQGNNVIVTANGTNDTGGTDYKVELSNNLDLTEQGSLTIGDVNIAGNKVDVGGNTITNVANGTNATDAVNLSQLNASKANVVAGTNVQVSSTSDENGTTYTVNAYNTTASGSELVSVVAGELDPTTNTTNYAIDLSEAAKEQLAKEESVEAGSDAVSVKLDGTNETGGNKYVVDLSDETKTQLAKEESVSQGNNVIVTANGTNDTGGTDYKVELSNNLDLTEQGSLTIGDVNIAGDKVDVGGNTITNVANGTNATDAVNLSQLNASKANVVAGTNVQVSSSSDENGTTYTVNAYNTTASGSELVSVVAGELDPMTNTTNYAIDLSDKAKAQLAKEESVEAGSDAVSVKLDGTNETGGNNYVVDLSDETKAQLAKEESVSQGNNVIVTANGTNETGGTDYKVELSNNLDLTEQGSLTIGDVNIAGDKVDVGGNTITNVANGTNATDAVNLSQLNASKANVVAGTNVQVSSTSDENGTTYTVNAYNTTASGSDAVSVDAKFDATTNTTNYAIDLSQATKDQIAKEESVSQGNNVIVTTNGTNETGGTDYLVSLSNDLDLTDKGSLTIGDVNIAGDKVDVGGNTITNVANGTNATDAVNLSQLNASKANVVAGTNVQVSSSSDENGTTYTVNAYNTTASGSDAVSVDAKFDATTNTTNYAIDLSQAIKDQIAKEESVEAGSDAVSVKLDGSNETGGNNYVVDLSQATKDQIAKEESVSASDNVVVTTNGTNATGGKDYKVSVVTADLSNNTFGKVELKELAQANQALSSAIAELVVAETAAEKAAAQAKVDAATALVSRAGNALATAANVQEAVNNSGWTTKLSNGETVLVNPGDQVNYVNGNGTTANVTVTQSENGDVVSVSYDVQQTNLEISEQGSVIMPDNIEGGKFVNASTIAQSINNVGWNVNSTKVEGSTGIVTEDSTKTATKVSSGNTVNVNAGNNIIITRTERDIAIATSMSPVFESVTTNSVTVKQDLKVENGANVDMGNNQIHNVKAGTADTDAVNVGQLKQGLGNVQSQISKVDKRVRGVGATAAAGMSLPQVYIPGKSMAAVSAGTYGGESAVAVGYSRASDNGKLILKFTGGVNSQGDLSGGVGVGYQW